MTRRRARKGQMGAGHARYPIVPEEGTWPEKAYKNLNFLQSADGRLIRVMCEFAEPEARFRRLGVRHTIVFYGSARLISTPDAIAQLENAKAHGDKAAIHRAEVDIEMAQYYDDAQELARRMALWSMELPKRKQFAITTGGGPGIMEAANRGAHLAGAPNVGLNISLPFEQDANPFQTPELAFEFHYFFVRKFWFMYLAKALVAFPGGFGTLDELFELLTLVQTKKTVKRVPIIIYGKEFWKNLINWEYLVDRQVISREDLDLFIFCDTVDEAFDHLTAELKRTYL